MYFKLHFKLDLYTNYSYDRVEEVLITSYGAPLVQIASYLAQHSSLFGPDGTVNYDYIITINSLLIGA